MRQVQLRLHEELVVDSFAGGGGASVGIEWALGRSPDIAVNHDPEAIAMHAANHPQTRHYCENVLDIEPCQVTGGRRVGLMWLSPDCTFHSKARGGQPFRDRNRARRRRGLAWIAVRWAKAVRPRVLVLENVEEFEDWGPLGEDGLPDPERAGFTFRRWVTQLENLGYRVEWRQLRACDFGAPTSRKRLFIIARCDGEAVVWPLPTHGPGLLPYRTAAECISWELPCPSIFDRLRPLADKTLARIARGIRRYVIDAAEPFIVPSTRIASPALIQQSWGERKGQAPRTLDIHAPLGTIVAGGIKHALVSAFLAKHNGGHEATGQDFRRAFDTITCKDTKAVVSAAIAPADPVNAEWLENQPPSARAAAVNRSSEVRAFLLKYYGAEQQDPRLERPLHTITTKHRFGLVTVRGTDYVIADIGMRMLVPRELFRAQGFPADYQIEIDYQGKPLSKTAQVRMVGNSVAPHLSQALVAANYADQSAVRRTA